MDVTTRPKVRHGWLSLGLSLCLAACGGMEEPDREPLLFGVKKKYDEAVDRLETNHLENGWVVSRKLDGKTPEHQGEGLIWSGLWMAAAPCDKADHTSEMLRKTISGLEGALIRISPLGEYGGGSNREVTIDGALGLYRGIAERVERCHEGEKWAPVIRDHFTFLASNNNKLHPNVKAKLIKEFTYVLDLLGYRLGLRGRPSKDRLRLLEAQVTSWAAAVMAAKAAAYRIHLGFLALETVERMGESVNWVSFCAASNGVDIPLIDHRCGRGDLKGWIDAYQYNEWEYRHQRSGKWEKPDGHGDYTPGLDLIVAIRNAYIL